jgi:hypothetical protein
MHGEVPAQQPAESCWPGQAQNGQWAIANCSAAAMPSTTAAVNNLPLLLAGLSRHHTASPSLHPSRPLPFPLLLFSRLIPSSHLSRQTPWHSFIGTGGGRREQKMGLGLLTCSGNWMGLGRRRTESSEAVGSRRHSSHGLLLLGWTDCWAGSVLRPPHSSRPGAIIIIHSQPASRASPSHPFTQSHPASHPTNSSLPSHLIHLYILTSPPLTQSNPTTSSCVLFDYFIAKLSNNPNPKEQKCCHPPLMKKSVGKRRRRRQRRKHKRFGKKWWHIHRTAN